MSTTITPGKITRRAVGDLRESDWNPRVIRDERFEQLKRSIEATPDMMKARPIIATQSGEIIGGNMRHRAVVDLGWKDVPTYTLPDDTPKNELREWATRDNVPFGEWVPDLLTDLVLDHKEDGGSIDLLGFSDAEVSRLLLNGGGGEAGGDDPLPDVWGVVVECENERQQLELLERLSGEGLHVRSLMQ